MEAMTEMQPLDTLNHVRLKLQTLWTFLAADNRDDHQGAALMLDDLITDLRRAATELDTPPEGAA